jgi:hypothetical protein
MSDAERYRRRAAEIDAAAKWAPTQEKQIELEHLARAYLRLAEQADRNAETDVIYGAILPPRTEPNAK